MFRLAVRLSKTRERDAPAVTYSTVVSLLSAIRGTGVRMNMKTYMLVLEEERVAIMSDGVE